MKQAPGNSPLPESIKVQMPGMTRACPPSETLARVVPHTRRMGITRIADVTGLDDIGIPVALAFRPNSFSLSVAQGKGASVQAAKASALMEAVESFHAEQIMSPLRLCSHKELSSAARVVDVSKLPTCTDSLFHPDLRTLWIEGTDLFSGEAVWVPYEPVHTDYRLPPVTGSGCFIASTNGLASGNRWDEAVVHACNEVIERDAMSLWNQGPVEARLQTRVNPQTVDDPSCQALLDLLEKREVEVGIWNMTTDLGIAVFLCVLVARESGTGRAQYPGVGSGAHIQREVALSRALTEAAQVRLTYLTGSRDDLTANDYKLSGMPTKLNECEWLLNSADPCCDFMKTPSHDLPTFGGDIVYTKARLLEAAVEELVVVDLTHEDLSIPVVRVLIPGLEGPDDHPRYVPGMRAKAFETSNP